MDPIEALLHMTLDELVSGVFSLENTKEPRFPQPHAADDPKTATLASMPDILHKNIHELESMAKENFCHQFAAIILRKIAFTKSLLAFQDPSEDLSALSERISVVEKAFFHQSADYGWQASCSPTSRQAEEVGEEDAVAFSFGKKIGEIEKDGNIDDYCGIPTTVGYLGHFFAGELKREREEKAEELDGSVKRFSNRRSELADPDGLIDDAIGNNGSSSCPCTSACFDRTEEMENQAEEKENTVSTGNETEELCSFVTEKVMEGKCETADSGGGDGAWRFGKLLAFRAMVGIFAVAAIGVVVGSLLSDKGMVNLVPT